MSITHEIRRAAFHLLARREHSAAELLRKLSNKDFNEEDIHIVLAELSKEGLQSDQRFTESFVRYRREMGYGPLRIQAELKERGINSDLIAQHLDIHSDTWTTDIRQAWQKRFKNHLPNDYKTRAQQMRFLQYRGFTHEQIKRIFREVD